MILIIPIKNIKYFDQKKNTLEILQMLGVQNIDLFLSLTLNMTKNDDFFYISW